MYEAIALSVVIPQIIAPTLQLLRMDSPMARVMLLAIGQQETDFAHRQQIGGPARSYWQFEPNGINGVLSHAKAHAADLCNALGVAVSGEQVYARMATDDQLGCGFARLLLWTDPQPLPAHSDDAWAYYQRLWRPGRPRLEAWPDHWQRACDLVLPKEHV